MRSYLMTVVMLGIEVLVVVHWFLLPANGLLAVVAMVAAVVMTLMAACDVILMVAALRKDPADPQQHRELVDLAEIEPLWAFATFMQLLFIAAAVLAGVYWIAAIVAVGQGAELIAVAGARHRRGTQPLEPSV